MIDMKKFSQFIEEANKVSKKLTPPGKAYKPKVNCYGRTVDYKMAPGKKVCAFNPGGGGPSDD